VGARHASCRFLLLATSRPYRVRQCFHSRPLWLRPRGISAIGAPHQSLRAGASTSSYRSTMRRIASAGASAPAIDLGVQLGVVLEFDPELGVAVRRRVGIWDRFFPSCVSRIRKPRFSTIFPVGQTGHGRTADPQKSAQCVPPLFSA